ncbi:hypothetical protein A2783_01640 [Microgenomates group bacterium RIFCSPHIGHO2_01_FULL_45_11]|nr:MAG: hypothetical protein A2783_01640 [Microgenomates group bacterium RIFCSPHIGHO2_01_FULL_45_11]
MPPNIQELTSKLLSLLHFSSYEVSVSEAEPGLTVDIKLPLEEAGTLIGRHGETIDSFQLVLNLMINQSQATWQRIMVNVNDYRQNRQQVLQEMADKAAANSLITGKPVILTFLPSHERRLVHLHLSQNPNIETYSEGIGRFRRLVVNAKKSSQ